MIQLACHDVLLAFGGIVALNGVSLEVPQGSIFAIIGPNGAGKSSLLNCISGIYAPQRGSVTFGGVNISRHSPSDRALMGMARTFQNLALFHDMDVLDTIMTGRHARMKGSAFTDGLFWGPASREEARHREKAEEIALSLGLADCLYRPAGSLPYGFQKRVELARALATEPRLLLLDEPMAGMNAGEREEMARTVIEVNARLGTTVVMIEHDMGIVMEISDQVCVLDFGKRIAVGDPAAVRADRHVINAYLGVPED